MNISIFTGRMYNGAAYPYDDKASGDERVMFRGRMNYRLPNGEYAWVDAVCFRDNPSTEANGLVGWLESNYLAPEDQEDGYGGRAIEVVGWMNPTIKRKTIEVKVKGGGTREIPNVEYETFELIIDQASFVPTNAGENNSRRDTPIIDDDEDFEFDDIDDNEEPIEDEPTPPRRSSNAGRSGNRSASTSTARSNSSRSSSGSSRSGSRSTQTSTGTRKANRSEQKNSRSTGSRTTSNTRTKKTEDEPFFID